MQERRGHRKHFRPPSETVRGARKWRAQAQLDHPGLGEKSRSETKPVPTEGLRVLSESAQMVLIDQQLQRASLGGSHCPIG